MFDILTLGEILIDFTPTDELTFKANPGGASANLIVCASKLGLKTSFMGAVGNDKFGEFLKSVLKNQNVNIDGLISVDVNTTLAFVHLDKSGDRSFSFYRNPGSDTMFEKENLNLKLIDDCKIFHFGALNLTHNPTRDTTFYAIDYAKKQNKLISFDPNLRESLWDNLKDAKKYLLEGIKKSDILKLSETELEFLFGNIDYEEGCKKILSMGPKLVALTVGENGSYIAAEGIFSHIPTYKVNVVDTTGSGDSFLGALLYKICKNSYNINKPSKEELIKFFKFANATGSLCATKKGAIPAMPSLDEVENLINNG